MWVSVTTLLRAAGHGGAVHNVFQVVPTVVLLFVFVLLFDLATSHYSPAAGDNGSGVAAAIALGLALDAAPPRLRRSPFRRSIEPQSSGYCWSTG